MTGSDMNPFEKAAMWAAGGAAVGAAWGTMVGGWGKPAVGEASMAYVGKMTAANAGSFAAIAAVFAVTETSLTQSRGPSPFNAAAAGCLAGAMLGAREGSFNKAAIACGVFGMGQFLGEVGNGALSDDPH